MIFLNKQKRIESQVNTYCEQVFLCLDGFQKAIEQYCQTSDRNQLQRNSGKVHHAESIADDLRREIEVMMYSKSLFPESRGDILGLLETADKVPNRAEEVLRMLLIQHIVIPAQFRPGILQLVNIDHRCVTALLEGIGKLFSDFTNATVAIGRVDELESEGDHLEANIIELIFAEEMDGIEKILLRDLVVAIGSICDRAANAGDRIRIIVAKRSI